MSITHAAGDQNKPASDAPAAPAPAPARQGWAAWFFFHLVPNALILTALVGLGWWGHHNGWKLPKFSELSGEAAGEQDDWCKEHGVPESICVECKPEKYPRYKSPGWCEEHGVHECPLEHPEIAQLASPPTITPAMRDRAKRALDFAARQENDPRCKLHLRRIQFASEAAVAKAGVEVAPAWERPVTESISANAEVGYDQARVARVSSPVAGVVRRVEKAIGDRVKPGELLAVLDAAEVGKAKSEFLQALAQTQARDKAVAVMRPAFNRGSVAEASLRDAEALAQEARIRLAAAEQALANLGLAVRAADHKGLSAEESARRVRPAGFSEGEVKAHRLDTSTANLFPVRAPQEGVVVAREREAVAGTVVEANKTLFVVADTRRMWLTLAVRQEDAARLVPRDPSGKGRPGQAVRFRAGGVGEVAGELDWVSTSVDERTRTVQARAELDNARGLLRAGTFGSARVILREEKQAVTVPSEALQWDGNCNVVFVRDKDYQREGAPKVFHVRSVRPGAKEGPFTEVVAGLLPGELVATRGSGVLRSELLKGNLGEG